METGRSAGFQEGQAEFRLGQGLSAGQGHAAARLLIEDAVLLNLGHDSGQRVFAADELQGFIHADVDAFSAGVAFGAVEDDRPAVGAGGQGFARAGLEAGMATGAAGRTGDQFDAGRYALGIVAP